MSWISGGPGEDGQAGVAGRQERVAVVHDADEHPQAEGGAVPLDEFGPPLGPQFDAVERRPVEIDRVHGG